MNPFAVSLLAVGLALTGLASCSAILGYDDTSSGGSTATGTAGAGGLGATGGGGTSTHPGGGIGGTGGIPTGGGTGGTGAAGGQGGASQCPHDECTPGEALAEMCSECVVQVCAQQAACCADAWTVACALRAELLCGMSCPSVCVIAFGGTAGFVLCNQGSGQCQFITTQNGSCADLCGAQATTCTAAGTITGSCEGVVTPINCATSTADPKLCNCHVQ